MMNYQYIEQLLDKYFECQTTLEEEQILRSFFAQEDVPAHLLKYRELFNSQSFGKNAETLGADFDQRILNAIGAEDIKSLIAKYPTVDPAAMGIPRGYQNEPLWQ